MQSKPSHVRCRVARLAVLMTISALALNQHASAQGFGALSLLFSPSAVANGMGNGFVAASLEASAIYYNPAALSRLGRMALEGNTFKLLPLFSDDARYRHFAGAYQISSTRGLWLGAAYTRAGYGKQSITDQDGQLLGEFESYERVFALAAATKLGQRSRFGAGFKIVHVNFGPVFGAADEKKNFDASAFAVDLGFLYEGFLPKAHFSKQFFGRPWPWHTWTHKGLSPGFSLGIALMNVGAKLKFIDEAQGDPLPQSLRIGLAWNVFESDLLGLVGAGEFTKLLVKRDETGKADGALKALFTAWGDQSLRDEFSEAIFAGGVEVSFLQFAALRFGRNWDGQADFGYNTIGYSIGPPGFRFSFAKYTPFRSFFIDEWRVYTVSITLDKLP